MTTNRSARVPLVHQSFSPLSTKCDPSDAGSAAVVMFAGSEPASTSVSANAEIAPFARRGKNRFFCSSVPNSASGCGTPIDCEADSSAVIEPSFEVTSSMARTYASGESPNPPYSVGILMPNAPIARSSSTTSSGI